MKAINPSGSRIDLDPADSINQVLRLVDSPALKVLQFRTAMPLATLEALNRDFFSMRRDVQLRAYAFYGQVCDLSFCSRLTNVERFAADSLRDASGVEHIAAMPRLTSLNIGIWHLDSLSFLREVNPSLRELCISETKSKKPDLLVLDRFRNLTRLFLNSQQKNVEVLASLKTLEILSLSSLTLKSLAFVKALPKLWSLVIMLGGTRDLSDLEGIESLKHLELSWIREFRDASIVSSLHGLQHLSLDRLMHITELPSLTALPHLRRVTMESMKGLVDISALISAPALEEVVHIDARVLPEAYIPILAKSTLKAAHAGFGSVAKNDRFSQLCQQRGIRRGFMEPFVFC